MVPLTLNARERELILQHTFAGDELTARLRIVPQSGETAIYAFNFDDLDDLAGSPAHITAAGSIGLSTA